MLQINIGFISLNIRFLKIYVSMYKLKKNCIRYKLNIENRASKLKYINIFLILLLWFKETKRKTFLFSKFFWFFIMIN